MAFNIIQNEAFKDLLELVARENVEVPSKYALMNTLSSQYEVFKSKIKMLIAAQEYICTTADVWSSAATSFFGMTLHFIDSNFVRQSMLLAFRQMKHKQTYIEITNMIRNIFADFEISSKKVTHIVTDGGSSFGKAFKTYGSGADPLVEKKASNSNESESSNSDSDSDIPFIQYDDGEQFYSNIINLNENNYDSNDDRNESLDAENENESNSFEFSDSENEMEEEVAEQSIGNLEEMNGEFEELPDQRRCLSHGLNLVGNDFEKDLGGRAKSCMMNTMNKLQSLWVFPRKSSQAKTFCREILLCLLIIPCLTRWNSKYDDVAKIVSVGPAKMEKYISALKRNVKSASHLMHLDKEDWKAINVYVKVMKPVAIALDRLQGEKDCSQGFILPTLYAMKHHLQNLDGGSLLNTCRDSMLKVINKRFSSFFEINDSNKTLLLASISVPRFKSNFIEREVDCLFVKNLLFVACGETFNSNSNQLDEVDSLETSNDQFFINFASSRTNRRGSFEQCIESEVSNYLIDTRQNLEMLKDYPHVQKMFYKYNTTLASSAAIERVFSQSNIIFNHRRNKILPENFEKILFLKHNRKLLNLY